MCRTDSNRMASRSTLITKWLVCWLFCWIFSPAHARLNYQQIQGWKAGEYIQFMNTARSNNDTTNLFPVLVSLEENLLLISSDRLIDELQHTMYFVEKKYPDLRYYVYAVYKKYYSNLLNKPKIFEYSYKMYKSLDKSIVNENVVWNLIDIGNIFFVEKEYKNAKRFYQKAEKLAHSIANKQPLAVIYVNYSLINEAESKLSEAIRNYQTSFKYRFESDNVKFISINYICIAQLYLRLKQPDSCLYYVNKAENYYYYKGQKSATLIDIPAQIFEVRSDYAKYFKNYDESRYYNKKGQQYCIDHGIGDILFDLEMGEVNLLLAQQAHNEAIYLLEFLHQKYLEDPEMLHQRKRICIQLGQLFKKVNAYQQANLFMNRAIQIDKKIDNSELNQQLGLMSSILTVFENESKLSSAQKELQLQRVSSELRIKERQASLLIAGVALVFGIVLILLFIVFQRNRMRLVKLQRKLVAQSNEDRIKGNELTVTNQLKDKLFSIIAHDLRNPLNRLLVELAIVRNKYPNNETVNEIESTLKQTIALFEEFLVWSRLYNKKNTVHLVRINLCEELHKSLVFNEIMLKEHGVEVHNDVQRGTRNMFVRSDFQIFKIIIETVLQKAIEQFSQHPKANFLRVEVDESGDQATIRFEIRSQGIDPNFSLFFNAHTNFSASLDSFYAAIYQLAVQVSGWEITCNSSENSAEISIVLPLYRSTLKDPEGELLRFNIPDEWKAQLSEVMQLKFYQISQIRNFIKSKSSIENQEVQSWLKKLEEAINESNEQYFMQLMKNLK